jgi:hypothetical protein
MTAETRKKIIEYVKPFKRGAVSFYISNETNAIVSRMAEEMEITKSEMLDTIVTFANAHYVNVEAWQKTLTQAWKVVKHDKENEGNSD